ncbi:MAG TPA: hypothetical protein VGD78_23050, partial [Chthoniobacterales bacterium]
MHPILENGKENFLPKYSPDGKKVAYVENRAALRVLNLESKQTRLMLSGDRNFSYSDDDVWFDWSPDGKWILAPYLQTGRWSHEIGLADVCGEQEIYNLTKSGYESSQPLWAQDGQSMIWLSDRYGLHGDDGNQGDPQLDVYQTFFSQKALNRFRLSPAEYEIVKANEDRTVRLTLASSRIVRAALSKDGEQLIYLAKSDKGFEIWLLKPRTKELKRLGEIESTPKRFGAFPQQLVLDQDDKNAIVLVDGR